jgi:glycosyltransferase involved in cell wall biosynthesis
MITEGSVNTPNHVPDPTLTVLTPSLNHGRFIREALDSVRVRPDISYEHLVIDGDSSDETAHVLARRPLLRVYVMPGLDSHEALNYGLSVTRGEIIGFLNADDRYDAGALDEVVDFFAGNPKVEAVCGGMRFFTEVGGLEQESLRFVHTTGEDLRLELTFGNPGFNSWFFRTALLRRLGGFRTHYRIAADRDLLLRVYAVTTPAALSRIVYHYRVHKGSRTMDPRGTNRQAMITDHLGLAQEQAEHVWAHDRAMMTMLAYWVTLERFKLFVRALRYRNLPILSTFLATPWYRLPVALYLRRRWLRILFAPGQLGLSPRNQKSLIRKC